MKLVSTTRSGPVSPVCLASSSDSKRSHSVFWKGVGATLFLFLRFWRQLPVLPPVCFVAAHGPSFVVLRTRLSDTVSVEPGNQAAVQHCQVSTHTLHRTNKTAAISLTTMSPKRQSSFSWSSVPFLLTENQQSTVPTFSIKENQIQEKIPNQVLSMLSLRSRFHSRYQ